MSTTFGSGRSDTAAVVPEFVPHPWLRNGHVQTIAGRYIPSPRLPIGSTYHEIDAGEGDRLSVLEACPEGWAPGGPSALLVHGLAGCARSPYVVRVAARLVGLGVRAVRMNLRGAGSGFGGARGIYHAGRTEDLRRVVEWMARRGGDGPIALLGFSLGANLVLKLAAEAAVRPLDGLDCVLAANPPLDLEACCRQIQRRENRVYDRNFIRLLQREVARLYAVFPDMPPLNVAQVSSLYEFDDVFTAPSNGFAGAAEYYTRSSAGPLVPQIQVPGLVVHAVDDPFIPPDPFYRIPFPAGLALELNSYGGHLGYFSHRPWDGDHRWLDARLAAWLTLRWALNSAPGACVPRMGRARWIHSHGGQDRHA